MIRSRAELRQAALSAKLLTLCGRRFRAERRRLARARNQAGSLRPARRARWGSGRQPGQQPSTGTTSPKTEAGGTDNDQKEDAGLVTADPNLVAAVPNVAAPVTNAVVAPVTDVVSPVADVVSPVADAVAPVADAVAPVTHVVAPVTNVSAPVSVVIAPGQDMVAGAVVPLTQLPSDLSSFMLGIAGVAPVGDGSGGIDDAGPSAAAGTSAASQLPLGAPLADSWGVPVAGNATRVVTLDVITLGRASALSGMAPQASNSASPMGADSSFREAFLKESPANRFLVGAGRCRSARRRGACDPCRCRGARRIRQANAGFASGTLGIARFAHPAGR